MNPGISTAIKERTFGDRLSIGQGQTSSSAIGVNDPRPLTRLEGAHGNIDSALASLRERVGILSNRMGAVLMPSGPLEGAPKAECTRVVCSPAVDKAELLAEDVRVIERTVIDLLERLEA